MHLRYTLEPDKDTQQFYWTSNVKPLHYYQTNGAGDDFNPLDRNPHLRKKKQQAFPAPSGECGFSRVIQGVTQQFQRVPFLFK